MKTPIQNGKSVCLEDKSREIVQAVIWSMEMVIRTDLNQDYSASLWKKVSETLGVEKDFLVLDWTYERKSSKILTLLDNWNS